MLLAGLLLTACDESILETSPLDQPSSENFFSNREELLLGVNATYNQLAFAPAWVLSLEWMLDTWSDIGWFRGNNGGAQDIGRGDADPTTDIIEGVWEAYYRGIGRANNLLQNMNRAEGNVDPELYERIRAEARFLRAYYYGRLAALYGDVPLVTTVQSLDEADVAQTPKAEVVAFILEELEAAAANLPVSYPASDEGRATKGAALALKARVALYDERWAEAADAAQRVIDLGIYELHPDYAELFTYAGEGSSEVILAYPYLLGTQTHWLPQFYGTRMIGSWAVFVPQQQLVDSYEMTDGLSISASPLYDPANPFENRDPRLDATILRPGNVFAGFRFETHPDSTVTTRVTTGERVENKDVTNPFATFTGYNWGKYLVDEDADRLRDSELNWILIRYAEVLLTYAEAKIEAGQIDASVYDALNRVRERVGMPPVAAGTSQAELREVVRHERKVELAGEGFRLFDLRRWGIAEEAMNGPVVGRPRLAFSTQGVPTFDEHGLPNYNAYLEAMRQVEQRRFDANRDYLWPIPQSELDVNPLLEQNPGY